MEWIDLLLSSYFASWSFKHGRSISSPQHSDKSLARLFQNIDAYMLSKWMPTTFCLLEASIRRQFTSFKYFFRLSKASVNGSFWREINFGSSYLSFCFVLIMTYVQNMWFDDVHLLAREVFPRLTFILSSQLTLTRSLKSISVYRATPNMMNE